MKQVINAALLAIAVVSPLFSIAQNTNASDPVEIKKTALISLDDIKDFRSSAGIDASQQTISNKNDALKFVRYVFQNHIKPTDNIYGDVKTFIDKIDQKEKQGRYTIIVLQHPLNLAKLNGPGKNASADAVAKYVSLCEKKNAANALIDQLNKSQQDINACVMKIPTGTTDTTCSDQGLLKKLKTLNELTVLKVTLGEEITSLEKQLNDLHSKYMKDVMEIQEDTSKLESYILNRENKDWTDYMLNTDRILLVFIGGKQDLMKSGIKINNKPSSFETSLNELYQLGSALGITKDNSDCSILEGASITDSIPITFTLLNEEKIKSPSDIELTLPGKDKSMVYSIHERMKFGLKVGFSGAMVDRNNFSLDSSNNLTIKTDSAKKQELKSNLMVLFEFVPWGRDIDRIEPVWAKNKDVKAFDLQRFGFVFGAKLSKNPLETIFTGLSYTLSKEASFNFGVAFVSTPKEVDKLPVGVNASLDYLKENADKELKPQLFIGLSFSPKMLGKALGVIK